MGCGKLFKFFCIYFFSEDTITELVDTTDITIIPTMNPDGFDRGKEGECSGADYKSGRFNQGKNNAMDAVCEDLSYR